MFALRVRFKRTPTADEWDAISSVLSQFHTQGIDEGEAPAPTGLSALRSGEERDEFEHALNPGVLKPPQHFTAYFANRDDLERAERALEPVVQPLQPEFSIAHEEPKDYSAVFRESFQPISTPHWLICASWHKVSPAEGQTLLSIEPGMAFGTGSHQTTRACLELLWEILEKNKTPKKLSALDFGCGSGILAIALKKLGVGNVYGIDIDPLSIEATQKNAAANKVNVAIGAGRRAYKNLDLIVANILKNTLLDHAERFSNWLKPGGNLILSGLLKEQKSEIVTAYAKAGFSLKKTIESSDEENFTWISLHFRKPLKKSEV